MGERASCCICVGLHADELHEKGLLKKAIELCSKDSDPIINPNVFGGLCTFYQDMDAYFDFDVGKEGYDESELSEFYGFYLSDYDSLYNDFDSQKVANDIKVAKEKFLELMGVPGDEFLFVCYG